MVIGGVPEKNQRQHRQRRALIPPSQIFPNGRARALSKIGARVTDVDHPHRTYEPVTLPNHGFEKAWLARVVAQSRTNFADDVVDVAVGVNKKIRAPKPGHNVRARNQLISSADQKNQQLHGLLLELYPVAQAA